MALKVKFVIEVRSGSIRSGAVIILCSDTVSDRFNDTRFNILVHKLLKTKCCKYKANFL